MSRHFAVTPPALDAIYAYCQSAMDGSGRVDADELARLLAENEPERLRQPQTREMTDSEYERSFEARFGPSFSEAPGPVDEDDAYRLDFQRRFGIEATA